MYFELNEIDISSDVFLSTSTLSSDFPISLAYEETINSLFLVSIFTMFFSLLWVRSAALSIALKYLSKDVVKIMLNSFGIKLEVFG